ncbi:Rne/Rng family ribonuclease, partial [Pseudoalteromonas citrea]
AFRRLRDYVGEDMVRIRVDSQLTLQEFQALTEDFVPLLAQVREYYPGERQHFDLFDVECEIQTALHRKGELTSGGSLIIDQ